MKASEPKHSSLILFRDEKCNHQLACVLLVFFLFLPPPQKKIQSEYSIKGANLLFREAWKMHVNCGRLAPFLANVAGLGEAGGKVRY